MKHSTPCKSLEAHWYTSPQTYDDETARIFQRCWLCVGRERQIPNVGDYFLCELEGESLIVVRDAERRIRAHYNVCRHRGTRLCEARQGSLSQTIRCPYHAWTYDLAGRLVGAPNMSDLEGFDKQDYPLQSAAAMVWEGFIFVSLANEPPPWPAPNIAQRFSPWRIDRLVSARQITYDVNANWKLLFQNYNECYHCPTVHPMLNSLSPAASASNDLTEGDVLGGPMSLSEEAESLSTDGRACGLPLAEGSELRRQVHYYSVFPTMLLSLHPDYALVHRLWRRGVARTRVACDFLFHPDSLAQPGFESEPAVAFWDLTNRQDWRVCELSQQGVASRAYRPGPYSPRESMLAAFDAHYLRVMGRV